MKRVVLDKYTTIAFASLIIMFILSTIITASMVSTLIKYAAVLFILSVYLLQTVNNPVLKKGDFIFVSLLIFLGLYVISVRDKDGFMLVLNQISLYLYAFVLYRFTWKKTHMKVFANIFYICLPLFFWGFYLKTD